MCREEFDNILAYPAQSLLSVCRIDQCATRSRRASVSEEGEEYEWFCSVERADDPERAESDL